MDVFGLLAVAVTTLLFVGAALGAASLYVSVRPMSAGEPNRGLLRLVSRDLWPDDLSDPVLALGQKPPQWRTLHLLMLPLAFAMLKLGASLMLSIIGSPDFDDTIGGPLIQAGALFLLAVIGYYSAVLYTALRRRSRVSSGS